MTESDFSSIVKKVNVNYDESWLRQSIEDTPLDSLELMELRSALEQKLGRPIPDAVWFDCETLDKLRQGLA